VTPFRWFLVVLSFITAIAVVLWVISSHWPADGAPLGISARTHLIAVGAVCVELMLRTAKIAYSARACGIPLAFGTAARATLCGDFLDAITPARVGAEPARFLVLREAGTPVAGTLVVLFLELWLEFLSLVLIAAGLLLFLDRSTALMVAVGTVGGYGLFVLGLGVIALMISRRDDGAPLPGWARSLRVGPGVWQHLLRTITHLRSGVTAFRRADPAMMSFALGCSVLHVLMRLTILPILVYSYGADVPLAPLMLWPLALLYAGALTPMPSGGGVMELGFNAALGDTIPAHLVAATLIWWRFYSFFIYSLLGALAAGRTAMRALGVTRAA
jgi:uncharacterized protein (TIRG00374 family)